jgi:AhpD family alkylhydroperoxidase
MNKILIRKAVRRSLARVRYVTPVAPGKAGGLVAEVYAQAERDFGVLAPPVVMHSPSPPSLAASWMMVRETLVAGDPAGRTAREVVAAAVSASNSCPYCVTIHASAVHELLGGALPDEIAAGRIEAIADPAIRQIAQAARDSGHRDSGHRDSGQRPAAPRRALPADLAAVAVTFHYLNRMVTVFLDDSPLPPKVPPRLKSKLMRMTATVMLSSAGTRLADGTALALLPPAPLPPELSWASAAPRPGTALARAAAAIDAAAAPVVSQPVRDLLHQELAAWDGRPPGPSRLWAQPALAALPAADLAAGRLALFTAFAPYQVIESDIAEFRTAQPQDEALIQLTSWASMAAARRIASWLPDPAATPAT